MHPANHIFEWVYNSQPLNVRMYDLRRKSANLSQTAAAMDALLIANAAMADQWGPVLMRAAGGMT